MRFKMGMNLIGGLFLIKFFGVEGAEMTKLFIFFLSISFLFELKAEEVSKVQMLEVGSACSVVETPPLTGYLQNIGSSSDAELIKGFSSIKFLLLTLPAPKNISIKIENETMQKLKQFGQVITKRPSIGDLVEDKAFLHSPFLIYEIKSVQDINGESLPFLQASLRCEAPLQVDKNNQQGQGILWAKECFLKKLQMKTLIWP